MNKINKELRRWRDSLSSQTGRLNVGGETVYVHRQEDSTWSGCPFFPTGSTDGGTSPAPKSRPVKDVTDKLDFIRMKNFRSAKDRVKRTRKAAAEREKYLQKTHLIEGCDLNYTKNS